MCKKHMLTLNWIKTEKKSNELNLGGSGGNLLGFNPTDYSVYLNSAPKMKAMGQSSGNVANVSAPAIESASKLAGVDEDMTMATTIAHESFHHIIGGTWGHFNEEGYIDSREGAAGGELSKKACNELCDELDIDK